MAKTIKFYIDKAKSELEEKDLKDIQVETAYTWCGRACAAVTMGLDEEAHEYAHEALEHAALTDSDSVFRAVRETLKSYKVKF